MCAPWITKNREVIFFGVETMDMYYRKGSRGGGENYVFAALDWGLRQNGFSVKATKMPVETYTAPQLSRYHRVFMNGIHYHSNTYNNHPEVTCKVRSLHFWGNWQGQEKHKPFDPRQILSPYPEDYNTFLGYFVHSLLWETQSFPAERPKQGLIIGKHSGYFKDPKIQVLLQALINDGFTLHTICQAKIDLRKGTRDCDLPPEIIRHGKMSPKEYAALMGEMAFLIGFGEPRASPSPLEGLAHGAAWLNPFRVQGPELEVAQKALHNYPLHWQDGSPTLLDTQHSPLSMLGMPYVYNIDLNNVTNVLEAARSAHKYRFSSYTPWEYRPEAMIARTCALLEDDALCQCPNPVFGGVTPTSDPNVDCHGSSYVRNPSTG